MKITEIVIACFNLKRMVAFYQNVFGLFIQDIEIPRGVIHEARIEDLKITLYPAKIAGITAKDNRQQLTFQMDDITSKIENVERFGGSIIRELQKVNDYFHIAIKDTDFNSIVLRQNLNSN